MSRRSLPRWSISSTGGDTSRTAEFASENPGGFARWGFTFRGSGCARSIIDITSLSSWRWPELSVAIAQTERRDLDSIILENGQSPFSVLPPDVVAVRRKLVSEQGQGVFIPPPPPTSFGIPENHPSADWVKRHLTPHPVSTFDSPSKSPTQSWIVGASSSATPTGRRWPTSILRASRAGAAAHLLTCDDARSSPR